jgi:cytoskeletal protein CcmA (bactofilin family)
MFGKDPGSIEGQSSLNSILGQGCKVKGNIELQGTIRVDGDFDGQVNCPETLIIGKSGVVKAEVKVKNAVIGGKLIGNIQASNKIELQSGSHVEGDIQTARLVIDEGVFFEGSCKMGTQTKPHAESTDKVWQKKDQEQEKEKTAAK